MKHLILFTILLGMPLLASARHFITDSAYRAHVDSAYYNKVKTMGDLWQISKLKPSNEETEALRFLYAYMPTADITDYPATFELKNVRATFKACKEMPWGDSVPNLLLRHFVLPVRVNNEPLDSARWVMYAELKNRVRHLSMKQAILEVNHWCHEHVTYEPADARTSSPLQTMRTGKGRCGEESTFAVAALRAVGIPARQVYAPRWAHTDDNHAWVEAWADGKWYFIGACEPEPVLNRAWFNVPASRALVTHTRVFGDYWGNEPVVRRTAHVTELNLIAHYADTASARVRVVDAQGYPVPGARVDYCIYNYAQYYPALTQYVDNEGCTKLTAGKGDMMIWASKDGRFGYGKLSFGSNRQITIRLSYGNTATARDEDVDIVPPVGKNDVPQPTAGQIAENKHRLEVEDSIRNSYLATFPTLESLKQYSVRYAIPYIIKARGNWRTIENFIQKYQNQLPRAIALLQTLTDKDLRDIQPEILADNMEATTDELSPRVEDEFLQKPFKRFFEKQFSGRQAEQFRQRPVKLIQWISDHITLDTDTLLQDLPQSAVSVWQTRKASRRSLDIFTVDLARSLGIPAWKNPVDGVVHVGTIVCDSVANGVLRLNNADIQGSDDPKYYYQFTLSRIKNGVPELLNYDYCPTNPRDMATWSNTFKNGIQLNAGQYLLLSGRRLESGKVLAHQVLFNVTPGDTTDVPLVIRHEADSLRPIGKVDVQWLNKENKLLSDSDRYFVLGVIGVGEEPTSHALRDINMLRADFNAMHTPFVLLFANKQMARDWHKYDYGQLPDNNRLLTDSDGKLMRELVNRLKLDSSSQLPVIVVVDRDGNVYYLRQGYTIGLGEQLKAILKQLH